YTKKDKMLQQQSKLASMGEMLGNIAHQWRQPLNALNINIQNLDDDFDEGLIDEKFIEEFIDKNREIIEFMSHTIDDFKNFFRIDKKKTIFSAKNAIQKVLSIQSATLKGNNITVELQGKDFSINGYESEFKQVILNITNNAKDALLDKKDENRKIEITLNTDTITIKDNANGIPEDILERIFEPYFTTKEQGKGTGMGLYMSKMIIEENINGSLSVGNTEDGAMFTIEIWDKSFKS
ncbi:MAG TPA: HAMP domain-containing histidine kinase, partial [Sulfurospirillum arcachonense]|nr:HAMP domain-containing histidine kinase [Sulfurospirillum arcachonense]